MPNPILLNRPILREEVTGVFTVALIVRIRQDAKVDFSKFDSPDLPGSGRCMDKDFIKKLKKLQRKTRLPIFNWINSGARSAYWNSRVGGVSNSAHKIPVCKAADIKTPTKAIRNSIVKAATEVGFTRIGIGKTFVHLDTDASKKQYVAWGYPAGTTPPINPFVV
ncbi:MAG: D-Ala-D-Ala carboxypeptidase family metallohydrolase [Bacteroidota bacterium]